MKIDMKAKIGVIERETFVAAHIIKFENGLVLKSQEVLWLGKERADEIERKFEEVVSELERLGIEFTE